MTDPAERRLTAQLLVDLVLDPRDPGYEAAARRRAGTTGRRWYDRPSVAVACLVIGFVLAVAWVHTHRGAPAEAKVHDRLVDRVRAAERASDRLSASAGALEQQLSALRRAALPGSSPLLRNLDREQLLAGTLGATGPGLRVTLSEPSVTTQPSAVPGRGNRTPISGGHILVDRDVRSVVNQLWSDGAEAIAVNGIRITPTSAIRFAGDAVLVDFQPIASPYVIDAIGSPDQLDTGFAASDVASRYQTLASARGIGFSFDEQDRLALPAGATGPLRAARVPGRPR
jgi:uncharacterized protein YlxW (UPF0749 family)